MYSKQNSFVFKPSKQFFQLTNKSINNNKPCLKKSLKHTLTSIDQKTFDYFKPVRPFQRFMKTKISNSGINEEATFLHFSQNDYSKPYKPKLNPILSEYINYSPPNNTKWSLGTTYVCRNETLIPKKDPFKEYYFTENINISKNTQNTFLPQMKNNNNNNNNNNDNDIVDKKNKSKNYFLEMKGAYNSSTESGSFWLPYKSILNTVSNRSSVNYNIINHEKNEYSGAKNANLLYKRTNNKNKGLEEIIDKQRLFAPNINLKYNKFYNDNKLRFRIYKGLFSDRYDSANKYGSKYNIFEGLKANVINNNIELNKKRMQREKTFYKF